VGATSASAPAATISAVDTTRTASRETSSSDTNAPNAGNRNATADPAWRVRNHSLVKWERVTEWPLVLAALLFLAAYAVPIIWPDLNHFLLNYTNHVIIGTWVVFGIDYIVRLVLAKDKFAFVRHNLVDLCSIILPVMRPLRLLRLVAALSVLNRIGIMTLRGRVISYSLSFAAMITFAGALAVTQVERAAVGSNIHTFGNGLWWSLVTLATVGYGDFYPVTLMGRVIAVVLMMTGVLLVGAISASLASWLVQHALAREPQAHDDETDVDTMLLQLQSLNGEVTTLSAALERHAATLAATQPGYSHHHVPIPAESELRDIPVDLTPYVDPHAFYDPTHPETE